MTAPDVAPDVVAEAVPVADAPAPVEVAPEPVAEVVAEPAAPVIEVVSAPVLVAVPVVPLRSHLDVQPGDTSVPETVVNERGVTVMTGNVWFFDAGGNRLR